jgi:type 2 lantibiotic biosynthesis protein LanM
MEQLIINLLNSDKWYDACYKQERDFINDSKSNITKETYLNDREWFVYLKSIFIEHKSKFTIDTLGFSNGEEMPFFQFLVPFIEKTALEVNEKIHNYNKLINTTKLCEIITKNICISILDLAHKTLIYELNKERIHDTLKGDTPKDRYKHFIKNKLTNYIDILKLLSEYPVLARLICECMKNKIDNYILAIKRLEKDKNEIEEKFKISLTEICDVSQMGDSHKNGATILKFTDKNNNSVIYKPKSLTIDVTFQNLLEWFNTKNALNYLKSLKVLDKDNYGWQEFINNEFCNTKDEVIRFFQRQGQYLGIFHMINATDFHYENIISYGEHPFFIDLESLFHPNFYENLDEFASIKANNILHDSVIRSSLLPVLAKTELHKFDVSGLAARETQRIETLKITNINTDIMKMEKQFVTIDTSFHLPRIGETIFYPEYYINEILKGFENSYFIIMNNIKELKSLILKQFQNMQIRIILRSTSLYSKFLNSSLHPRYLLDGLERERLFNYLGNDIRLKEVVDSECKEMLGNDIPYFWGKTDKCMVCGKYINSSELMRISPINSVINKIGKFDKIDYYRQKEFIKKSLLVNRSIIEENDNLKNFKLKGLSDDITVKGYNKNLFLKEAIRIADILDEKAIRGDNDSISWITLSMDSYENMQFTVLDASLYEGIAGICLFNAYLYEITKIDKYLNISKSCIKTMLHKKFNNNLIGVSAFSGHGSILYCLINLYKLWNEEWLLEEAKKSLLTIKEIIHTDRVFDFLGGVAGTLSVCIDIYISLNIKDALDIAIMCGNHLIENSINMEKGIGWKNKFEKTPPLAGLAHGNAGISYSLIKLYSITKEIKYLNSALKAIEYENSLYNEEIHNWRDLRNFSNLNISQEPIAWCNGAMGIGLARLLSLEYYKNDVIYNDFKRALEKTNRDSFVEVNYSLCHGDLGNIELPLIASIKLKNDELRNIVYLKVATILNKVKEDDGFWRCGIPGRCETESFMVGISGIGYQLLRLYDNKIPSILTLEMVNN